MPKCYAFRRAWRRLSRAPGHRNGVDDVRCSQRVEQPANDWFVNIAALIALLLLLLLVNMVVEGTLAPAARQPGLQDISIHAYPVANPPG